MSQSQADGFSEADGILSADQRGRGGETEAQRMGLGLGGGGEVTGPLLTQACPCALSLFHRHGAQTRLGSAELRMAFL